jgi:hypothetical protein
MNKRIRIITISTLLLFGKFLMLASNTEINNLPIANSWILSTEQSIVDNQSFNVISNPAMLGIDTKIDYLLEYNRLFYYAQTSYDNIGFLIGKSKVGIVINRFSSGQISVRDIDGVETNQTIEYSLTTLNFAAATELASFNKQNKLFAGITGSMNWEKINIETKSYNANIGLLYNYEGQNNSFVKTIRVGTVVKGITSKDNVVYHFGSLIKLSYLSIISGYENNFVNKENGKIKIGLLFELPLPYLSVQNISLGLGYMWGEQNKYISQTTKGIIIKFDNIIFSYSYAVHEYIGYINNVQIGIEL